MVVLMRVFLIDKVKPTFNYKKKHIYTRVRYFNDCKGLTRSQSQELSASSISQQRKQTEFYRWCELPTAGLYMCQFQSKMFMKCNVKENLYCSKF